MNRVHELVSELADELQDLVGLSASFTLRRGGTVVEVTLEVYEEEEDDDGE